VLAAVQAALAGGPRYDVEFRIVRKDGEVRVSLDWRRRRSASRRHAV
jgi:PAS domain-containing protein